MMVVRAKVKEYLHERGFRMSKEGWDGLEERLKEVLREAMNNAGDVRRVTLKCGDFVGS